MVETDKIVEQLNNPLLYLIISNLLVIVFALVYNWNIGEIIWTFLIQNIIIGFFNFLRIIKTNAIIPAIGPDSKEHPFIASIVLLMLKLLVSCFFVIPYLVVQTAIALFVHSSFKNVSLIHILISGGIFIIPHLISYIQKSKHDKEYQMDFIKLIYIPYIRTIPMFIIIFVIAFMGSNNKITLAAFLVLKTIADVKMHIKERKLNEPPTISFDDVVRNAARKT